MYERTSGSKVIVFVIVVALALGIAGAGFSVVSAERSGTEDAVVSASAEPAKVSVVSAERSGTGDSVVSTGPTGGIVIGSVGDVVSLNPLASADSYSQHALNLIYDPLFEVGPDLQPRGQLVVATETPDDETYIFHLREGVYFHDGTPLTAEDVKFTYDYILDPANAFSNRALYSLISSVEVIDEYTVKFTTSEPYAPLTTYLVVGIVPKHIAANDAKALGDNPVGSGPYKFVSWKPQDRLVLAANENWWVEGEPKIKDLTFMPIAEATTRLAALETGTIDVADNVPARRAASLFRRGIQAFNSPPNGYYLFAFNQSEPPFDSKLVREAFTIAIDRDAIVDFVWYGLNETADSPVISTSWAYEPDVVHHPYDPERAKQLLAEAGYPNGVTVNLLVETNDIVRRYAEPMMSQWAEVGIRVELVAKEWRAFFRDMINADFQLITFQWVGQDDPDRGLYRQFHSAMQPPYGHNYTHYSNSRVDELLDIGRTTLDQEQRAAAYREAQRHITDDFVYMYLADYRKVLAYSPRVKDFEYSPYAFFRPITKAYVTD